LAEQMGRRRMATARSMLRAYQSLHDGEVDEGLMADLAFIQHKDLDMSVRLGGLLAFNALLITAAINPVSASPGAPLSLDAARQPLETLLVCVGLIPLIISTLGCVRGLLIGEEFSIDGIEGDKAAIAQRMFAAYCVSIDLQVAVIRKAVWLTVLGGAISLLAWAVILAEKML
jgi:hypothetical protein